MKTKNYLLARLGTIALFLMIHLVSIGQPNLEPDWKFQNPLPTNENLKDVQFLDPQNGWAVGENGTILKSTNGGQNWIRQGYGITQNLHDLYFTDALTGWAVGDNANIFKTSNGGQNWINQPSGTLKYLTSIFFSNPQTGWVVGENGTILKTSNGGQNWIAQASGTLKYLTSVQFIDLQLGWAVGGSGFILKTTNGGQNWLAQTSGTTQGLSKVHFTDAQIGWAVGANGTILKTTNGGQNWFNQTSGTTQNISQIHFHDAQNGWALVRGIAFYKTSDGGQNWIVQNSGTINLPYSIHFLDTQTGWGVGYGGAILKTTNGGQNWLNQNSGIFEYFTSVQFVDVQTGWAVGRYGTIIKTTDGGQNWIKQNSGTFSHLNDVYFINAQTGWVASDLGMLKTTNGGQNWVSQPTGQISALRSVYFINSQTGWASNNGNWIIKTTNGGQDWIEQYLGLTSLYSLYFSDAQTGWGVGDGAAGSTIVKTTNGGQDWVVQESGSTEKFISVYFTDAQTGWAVGGSFPISSGTQIGKILKTTNGGQNWIDQSNGIASVLYSVSFADTQTGFAVGSGGTILKTTNGGQNWIPQRSGTTMPILSVHLFGSTQGWAVGPNGLILTNNPIKPGTPTSLISGKLFKKNTTNCITSPIPASNRMVKSLPGPFYAVSNNVGNYNLRLPLSDTATPITLQGINFQNQVYTSDVVCPPSNLYNLVLDTIPDTLSSKDFGFENILCHHLTIQLASDRRRRCFQNTTSVSFSNQGSIPALNAFILVEYPQWVRPVSSSNSYVALNDSVWRFNLGTVAAGDGGAFTITDSVLCGNVDILGLTQCTKATIYPAPDCPTGNWNGASLSAAGKCLGNGLVRLSLANLGTGNMLDSTSYRIFLDSNLVFQKRVKLVQNDSLILQVETNGMNVRLEADQVTNHPTQYSVTLNVESCGLTSQNISKGFVTKFPVAQSPNSKTHCLPILGAYDPNDKQAFPQGFTNQNIVPPNTRMEYMVRFQNTGTDTAFTVYVIDTLDQNLNVESFEMGSASHPYQLSMQTVKSGKTFLRWQFNNIQLPDSNTNQLKSNGFIQYRISPKPGLALGSQVRNYAAIYFDFNPPVITNQTLSTFNNITFTDPSLNNSVQIITALAGKLSPKQIGVNLYPNPVTEHSLTADFSTKGNLVLFNAQGQQVYEKENIEGKQVLPIHLKSGFYVAQLKTAKGVSVVKVVVE